MVKKSTDYLIEQRKTIPEKNIRSHIQKKQY